MERLPNEDKTVSFVFAVLFPNLSFRFFPTESSKNNSSVCVILNFISSEMFAAAVTSVCNLLITWNRFIVQKNTYLPKQLPYARHEGKWQGGFTNPLILQFGTRWRYLALRTDHFTYGRISRVRIEWEAVWTAEIAGNLWRRHKSRPVPGFETRFLRRPSLINRAVSGVYYYNWRHSLLMWIFLWPLCSGFRES